MLNLKIKLFKKNCEIWVKLSLPALFAGCKINCPQHIIVCRDVSVPKTGSKILEFTNAVPNIC